MFVVLYHSSVQHKRKELVLVGMRGANVMACEEVCVSILRKWNIEDDEGAPTIRYEPDLIRCSCHRGQFRFRTSSGWAVDDIG
jgi:nitrite reductase/ring-hydroxylating ferredoxin subunit